ncbi:MAG TPA: hormogonium polysaccharide biosynthesis protein HpsA, partial [Stenomitos sp.]
FEWKDNNGNKLYDFNGEVKRGDLQMRATVVYHSAQSSGSDQKPIACIATLYDPTSAKTAQNINGLPPDPDHQVPASAGDPNAPFMGISVNGISYSVAGLDTARASAHTNLTLVRQANMIFPDGRWVNKPLRDAVLKLGTPGQGISSLNIADIAAIDAANCALNIMKAPTAVSSSVVPNMAIKEEAFLDARQIKAIHKRDTIVNFPATTQPPYDLNDNRALVRLKDSAGNDVTRETTREYISNPDKLQIAELGELNWERENLKKTVANYPFYSLPIEQRQPLEIRVTQIDLNLLRKQPVGTNNYLLPNSGIIYASRDDALPDISDFNPNTDGDKGSSATDFFLDPTRRPNGILLVNGANLLRKNEYRIEEKGLILATDLPVYIKSQKLAGNPGGFNLHLKPDATAINDGTVREEFMEQVLPTYSNFYNRQATINGINGDGFNPNFACRKGQSGCTEGDQWRAARILSDAVTLLSSNFRFGYRNEGDFDLNNNVGNLAVESRLKQGFWWNAFATNGEWVDPANGYPKDFDAVTGTQGSTYVTNGVTPIQRRVNFPEYKMEICRKLPVAACGPGDWKATEKIDTNNDGVLDTDIPIGGTTAPSPATEPPLNDPTRIRYVAPADRRYPRRVAFQRNSAGELIVPDTCTAAAPANCKAIPIGAAGPVPYDGTTTPVPTAVNNALWFWTTGDNTNPSPVIGTPTLPTDVLTLPPNVSYNNTNKLYYAPFEPEEVSERQLLLPGLPEFPNVLKTAGIRSLNSTRNSTSATNLRSAPSDYSVFNFDSVSGVCNFSKDYKPATFVDCATDPETTTNKTAIQEAIQYAWGKLLTYNPTTNDDAVYLDKNDTINPLPFNPTGGLPIGDWQNKRTITLKAYAKVNIYSLPKPVNNTEILSGLDIIFDSNNRIDDPIFVIRPFDYAQNVANNTPLIFLNAVKVIPQGVDPNNIFWVPTKYLQFIVHNDSNDHALAGNFIGGGLENGQSLFAFVTNQRNPNGTFTTPTSSAPNILKGARFLGFDPTSVIPTGAMTAMTTTAEPLLIPVLNLHSPEGSPAKTVGDAFGGQTINQNYWVQRVLNEVTETYNAVFIMGDSPSRPFTGIANARYSGESGGGLGNFPRFLEAWQSPGPDSPADAADIPKFNANTKISGSFIQFKRSIFATAPFEAIDDPKQDNSLFFDTSATGLPDYMEPFAFAQNQQVPYVYKGGGQLRKAPYYRPPNRAWGYDIGLLKQSPDLFSRRFSTPSAGTPNEYYREVSRDDLWVKTLMCAAEQVPAAAVGAPPTYSQWAIADPKQRPSDCPNLSQYADPQP